MSHTASIALASASNVAAVANDATEKKTSITTNEGETMAKAFTAIHAIVKTMGKGDEPIASDYLTNPDTLGELLACAHRVWKREGEKRAHAEREAFAGKIDAAIQTVLDKRAKAIATYNALDADLKSEMTAPNPTVSVWVEDLLPVLGKGYDLSRAVKTLHDMGYMVHVTKEDKRRKDQTVTPPFITATVGKPIRTAVATAK